MLGIVRRLAVASGLAGSCLLTQAQVDAAPVGSWVDNLSAATQPGPTDDWGPQHAAEADVARKISELVATRPGAPELTARNPQGRTPLLRAALWGYASVVDALLADASVRAAIDTADFGGLTAWMAGQYAQPLTLASCHPQILITEAVGLWGPNLRRIAYFSTQSPTPFERIRTALARAGAKPDIEGAKRIWLNACPGHAPALEPAMAASEDIMATLLADTNPRLQTFFTELRGTPSRSKKLPPQPVLAIGPKQDSPVPDDFRCAAMPKPENESMMDDISSRIVLRVEAEVQDGVPVAARITYLDNDVTMPASQAMRIRASVYTALGGYRCLGDHIFRQEFEFRT